MVIIYLIMVVLCALLYRASGMSKDVDARPKWMPMFLRNSWIRDWVIPILTYGFLILHLKLDLLGWVLLLISVGLTGGAISNYWKKLFGFANFWFYGFMIGLAVIPLGFIAISWWTIFLRAFILAIGMGLYCKLEGTDWKEEMFRGGLIAATIPILL